MKHASYPTFITLFAPAALPGPQRAGENRLLAAAPARRCAPAITGGRGFTALLEPQRSH